MSAGPPGGVLEVTGGGTLAGITLGGWLVARIGLARALISTGLAQMGAMAMYVWLAHSHGDHTVLFAGPGERLELKHQAHSRENFARGSLRAGLWVTGGRKPGLYSMAQVLGFQK